MCQDDGNHSSRNRESNNTKVWLISRRREMRCLSVFLHKISLSDSQALSCEHFQLQSTMVQDVFFSIVFSLVLGSTIFGIFIGLVIIVIIVRHQQYRDIPNLLVCNTTVAAILFLCTTVEICINGFQPKWTLTQSACMSRTYCVVMFSTAFLYSYVIQSINHLFSVIYSHKRHLLAWHTSCWLIACAWMVSIMLPVHPLLAGAFVSEPGIRLCVVTPRYLSVSIYLLTFGIVLPYAIILFIYAKVIRHIRRASKQIFPTTIIDLATLILAKKHREELRAMTHIMVQAGICGLGAIPSPILTSTFHLGVLGSISDELFVFATLSMPVLITCILAVICATNRMIKQTLLSDRRFSDIAYEWPTNLLLVSRVNIDWLKKEGG